MAYFGVIFFANTGGGGGQNYFHGKLYAAFGVEMIFIREGHKCATNNLRIQNSQGLLG